MSDRGRTRWGSSSPAQDASRHRARPGRKGNVRYDLYIQKMDERLFVPAQHQSIEDPQARNVRSRRRRTSVRRRLYGWQASTTGAGERGGLTGPLLSTWSGARLSMCCRIAQPPEQPDGSVNTPRRWSRLSTAAIALRPSLCFVRFGSKWTNSAANRTTEFPRSPNSRTCWKVTGNRHDLKQVARSAIYRFAPKTFSMVQSSEAADRSRVAKRHLVAYLSPLDAAEHEGLEGGRGNRDAHRSRARAELGAPGVGPLLHCTQSRPRRRQGDK